ncbi:RNase E specificity factor CsrD [Shewanella sp. 202IG2-18]|uniref:RNase E specificity factor CsrD n=1 Tax=Parashewanella hymeniacidonis TaxID=2807618 RepID=UPI00196070F8|nr:RNase E specificity factor CsrD [Parashewanella hymeniacidonis]MBM7073089.1 RNase E specificity factor CsrD [Parashewanella hymeniacidonis]
MKLTRMLTKKLASFWLGSLIAVAVVFLIAALLSFFHLANRMQQQQVTELQEMLLQHHHQHLTWELDDWLPPVLMSYKTVTFELTQNGRSLFQYQGNIHTPFVTEYHKAFDPEHKVVMHVTLESPYVLHRVDGVEVAIILIALSLIGLYVRYGFNWLYKQLFGVEELVARGQMVLNGEHHRALENRGNGQPRIINRALTQLLEELQDAHKERSRFDKFIRSNTFLDADTGIGNRLYLKNRIAALSNDYGMLSHGVIYLLEMEELDVLQQDAGEAAIIEYLTTCVTAIDSALKNQANSFIARREFNQFAIVIPQISLLEADSIAAKVLSICQRIPMPEGFKLDNFYHIGGAYFSVQDKPSQLIEEAEMALRAAQYQGNNSWFMYDKGSVDQEFAKGSVRWRALLEMALEKKRFVHFATPTLDFDGEILHQEIFARLREKKDSYIRATQYAPMAVKCGLMPQIDRMLINELFDKYLKHKKYQGQHYCINLSLDSVMSEQFVSWLKTTLLEHRNHVSNLIFEVNESAAFKHSEQLKPVFNIIRKMGAKISVDFVGQQVVGSQYLKELQVDFIKLHPSIIRQIHLRPENQLFVRSLIGALFKTEIQIQAEGVVSFEEWQILKVLGVTGGQGPYFQELKEL